MTTERFYTLARGVLQNHARVTHIIDIGETTESSPRFVVHIGQYSVKFGLEQEEIPFGYVLKAHFSEFMTGEKTVFFHDMTFKISRISFKDGFLKALNTIHSMFLGYPIIADEL